MYFEKETRAKTFTYLYRARQRLKELFSFSKKTQTAFTGEHAKAKQEEGHRNQQSSHMLILRVFTTTLLKRSECNLEYWLQLQYLDRNRSQQACLGKLMFRLLALEQKCLSLH